MGRSVLASDTAVLMFNAGTIKYFTHEGQKRLNRNCWSSVARTPFVSSSSVLPQVLHFLLSSSGGKPPPVEENAHVRGAATACRRRLADAAPQCLPHDAAGRRPSALKRRASAAGHRGEGVRKSRDAARNMWEKMWVAVSTVKNQKLGLKIRYGHRVCSRTERFKYCVILSDISDRRDPPS